MAKMLTLSFLVEDEEDVDLISSCVANTIEGLISNGDTQGDIDLMSKISKEANVTYG